MIKTFYKLGTQGGILNLIKIVSEKPTVNMILFRLSVENFPVETRNKARILNIQTYIPFTRAAFYWRSYPEA